MQTLHYLMPRCFGKPFSRNLLLLLALLLLTSTAAAASPLAGEIDALLASPDLAHGVQGIMVQSLQTGSVLYERNPDLALIPASNLKLITSAAALDRLGPNYTWKTQLLARGETKDGVLRGDLILKGGGDPVLETADLAQMAAQVRSSGIARVTGRLIVDDTLFDNERLGRGWSWDDIPYYYTAQISALNVNRNVVDVYVDPRKAPGSPAVIRLVPATGYVAVRSTAVTGRADSKRDISVYREIGRNVITVSGTVPSGVKAPEPDEPITVEEPAVFAGQVLRDLLRAKGVTVTGGVTAGVAPAGAAAVCSHTSPPLSTVLALLNKPSDNLIAEVLLKTIGLSARGKGTTQDGVSAAADFLRAAGANPDDVKMVDGSGLSRMNLVTPRTLMAVLRFMNAHRCRDIYLNSLPVAGVDGTLKNRMKKTAAEGKVRAKTGYLSGVSCLSGYVNARNGEPLAFVIMMNNHLCQNSGAVKVQDAICQLLLDWGG